MMAETLKDTKQFEQYPLLSGDGIEVVRVSVPPPKMTPGWRNFGKPKSWADRWPEFLSACWMTFILLGISFLVFYLVGISVYRRQPVIIMKNSPTKSASNVFFHQIIPRGSYIPFSLYSDYLSTLAQQYPLLTFNVIFLKEDPLPAGFRDSKHHNIIRHLVPYNPMDEFFSRIDEDNKRMVRDFMLRFQNVNISITCLSTHMALTPLKYKWRSIPRFYLPFYARVSAIWQYGGIGLDLTTFNNQFRNTHVDSRISAIFKQHNDGINFEEYAEMLNIISDKEDKNNFETIFMSLFDSILNKSHNIFNYTLPYRGVSDDKKALNNRTKRELTGPGVSENKTTILIRDIENKTDAKSLSTPYIILNETKNVSEKFNTTEVNFTTHSKVKKDSPDVPEVLLLYDFSIISHGIGPSYAFAETQSDVVKRRSNRNALKQKGPPQFLTIDSDGLFVAASSRLHPFLGHLFVIADQKFHPRCAIRDAFNAQCSGIFVEDNYCNNIFFL